MRNVIILLAAISLVTAVSVLSCNDSSQNTETLQTNNPDSTNIKDSINAEYMKDIDSYRKQINDTIDANIKSIADFKIKIQHDKKYAKGFYDEKIEALRKDNTEMKKKIVEYKAEGKEFSDGMDTLGRAFKDLISKA